MESRRKVDDDAAEDSSRLVYLPRVATKRIDRDELIRRGKRLEAWRIARGFATQDDLAVAAGITQPQVSNYEAGNRWMSGDTLIKVSTALRITPADLMGDGPIEAARHSIQSDEVIDPKEQVRRDSLYHSAPEAVRYWFDHDDKFTSTKDVSKLTVRVYSRRLEEIWRDWEAGILPTLGELLEGAEIVPPPDDPDDPRRG